MRWQEDFALFGCVMYTNVCIRRGMSTVEARRRDKKTIYYQDELEDEFSEAKITPRKIDGEYDYEGGVPRKIARVFLYHVLAKGMAFIYLKLKYRHKIVNKECLKQTGKTGFFLYGNHTNAMADALIPSMLRWPLGVYVIVHANNVSMPVLGRLTPCLGAIPLPDDKKAMQNFSKAIERLIQRKQCITIYPEAHIWPYYTKIRNFKDSSFRYPVGCGVPVYCFTNTYQKRKKGKIPQIVTYVDGPFYPDKDLSVREQKRQLHQSVMTSMKKHCKNSNVEVIRYVKKEE